MSKTYSSFSDNVDLCLNYYFDDSSKLISENMKQSSIISSNDNNYSTDTPANSIQCRVDDNSQQGSSSVYIPPCEKKRISNISFHNLTDKLIRCRRAAEIKFEEDNATNRGSKFFDCNVLALLVE